MPKPTPDPSRITIAPPGPLAATLTIGGFVAELVIRRADGAPLSAEDQRQAAWLVKASEDTETTDEQATAAVGAFLDEQAAGGRGAAK